MIGKAFSFKGTNLMHTSADFRIGVKGVDRRKVSTSYDRIPYMYRHGGITSNSYARGRTITIEGYIIASTRVNTSKGMDRLDSLFSLTGYTTSADLSQFNITDEQDRVRYCNCTVQDVVEYDIEEDNDHTEGAIRRWRVVLFAPDPVLYSTTLDTITGTEGSLGGVVIGADGFIIGDFGVALDELVNEILVQGFGGFPTPVIVKITANENISQREITLYNVTTGKFFKVDIGMSIGEVLVINGINATLTLDGVNIISNRVTGSVRPSVLGDTYFLVYDIYDLGASPKYDVEIEYRKSLI